MAEAPTLFRITHYDSRVGKIAILTMDNGEDYKKPNTFGEDALASLTSAMDIIGADKDVKGMMLCGKHYIFAAGADLTQVPFVNTFEQGRATGAAGHKAMKRIMDLKVPTLAAINGVALGGGLEIGLYCDYRTVSKAVAAIAFPECFLGLMATPRHRPLKGRPGSWVARGRRSGGAWNPGLVLRSLGNCQ